MKRSKWLIVVPSALVLTMMAVGCEVRGGGPFSNPPASFQETDLVGTWEAHYGRSVDRLILRGDRTFKQIYRDNYEKDYVYETPWNKWWVERFPNGRARLHLQGARNYRVGILLAERDGLHHPCPKEYPDCHWASEPYDYYDPFAREFVDMVNKLVLNVRSDSSGELLLLHLWRGGDEGFPIFGGEVMVFRRISTP